MGPSIVATANDLLAVQVVRKPPILLDFLVLCSVVGLSLRLVLFVQLVVIIAVYRVETGRLLRLLAAHQSSLQLLQLLNVVLELLDNL